MNCKICGSALWGNPNRQPDDIWCDPDCYRQSLEAQNTKMREALEWYAKQKKYGMKYNPGDRKEFGCGCCAGVVDADGIVQFDDEVIGLTARECLREIEEMGK